MRVVSFGHGQNPMLLRGLIGNWILGGIGSGRGLADVPKLQEILGRKVFSILSGIPPTSFVLADGAGLSVAVHAVVFDDKGNGVYRMQNGANWNDPAEGFLGQGTRGEQAGARNV